jgi:hypothetical protein
MAIISVQVQFQFGYNNCIKLYHTFKANVNLALKTPAFLNSFPSDFYVPQSAYHKAKKFAPQMPEMQEPKAGLRRVAIAVDTLSIALSKKLSNQ